MARRKTLMTMMMKKKTSESISQSASLALEEVPQKESSLFEIQ